MQRTLLFSAFILVFSVCFFGCSPFVKRSNLIPVPLTSRPNDPTEFYFFEKTEPHPANPQVIGDLKIGDTGFTFSCSYERILELAKEATQKAGGNAFKIQKHQTPDAWSTCHRIEGKMFLLTPEQIAAYKNRNAPDLEKIKARQKFYYDSLVMAAGDSGVHVRVSQQPQFPGGEEAMMKYLSSSVKYPVTAMKDKVTGLNVAQFVIDQNGEISEVTIIKSIREDLDEETKRIIRNMPRWVPGFQNGNAVKVKYTIPMRYSIGRKNG